MGANSTQGWSVLLFLVAFSALGVALFSGSVLGVLVFVLALVGSIALSLKAKPLEQ